MSPAHSAENGEKAEREAESKGSEVNPEQPKAKKPVTVKKGKSAKEGGFELWNELDVQRNKCMVSI